ncbi:WD repeat-containing protein 74 isoform X2 [Cylas formicarius]|nr:WD repeat-containing protein 74 isoform X2 [Cylas formicarius]
MVKGRNEDEIILGYQSGHVGVYNTQQNEFIKSLTDLEGDGGIIGAGCVKKAIISAKRNGIIHVSKGKKRDYFSVNLDEKGTLESLICNDNRDNIVGIGGEFNNFKLFNLETKQCVFKAKSLGHDELQLPIPTSVRSIIFFPDVPNLAACATKEGYVLLYDDRAQRKPISKFLEKQASYTTISPAFRERQCFVGTTKGYMQMLDLKTAKCLKTFTNYTGSVTSIICDPVEPYIASTSLDRYLRVHNIDTKELVYKCYMKQNLTKLFLKPIIKDEGEEKQKQDENVDEEYEEMFRNMETVIDEDEIPKKKKRKSLHDNLRKK